MHRHELMLRVVRLLDPISKTVGLPYFLLRSWFMDNEYSPTTEYDINYVLEWWKTSKELQTLRKHRVFDCDDYALVFTALARLITRTNAFGIAVGYAGYPHAWVIAVTKDKLIYVDPMLCEITNKKNYLLKSVIF